MKNMGISLDSLNELSAGNYKIRLLKNRLGINNYDDFLSALYDDLDFCIKGIQDKKKFLQPDKNGEDRVTAFLQGELNAMLYTSDSKFVSGGNTDLTISSFCGEYRWIGEAKRVDGIDNTHIWGGFLQLAERYTDGDEPYSGILVYIFAKGAKSIMDSYRTYSSERKEYEFTYQDCSTRKAGGFYSTHKHTTSELDFTTRYIPVLLHYDPVK